MKRSGKLKKGSLRRGGPKDRRGQFQYLNICAGCWGDGKFPRVMMSDMDKGNIDDGCVGREFQYGAKTVRTRLLRSEEDGTETW